ncbi:MAG: DUF3038 domain-containing protein [Microcystaceae cyanobacterium]
MDESQVATETPPNILDRLPDFLITGTRSATHLQMELDLILLSIEALEVGASELILEAAKELRLDNIIKNRLSLWRLRCSNPWRRSYTRQNLTLDQAKALVILAHYRAKQLNVPIRQLLLAQQQMLDKGLPITGNFLLSDYLERFRAHFRSRMNPKRAKVAVFLDNEAQLNEFALSLLNKVLFLNGTMGLQRFWISLFDGEVA